MRVRFALKQSFFLRDCPLRSGVDENAFARQATAVLLQAKLADTPVEVAEIFSHDEFLYNVFRSKATQFLLGLTYYAAIKKRDTSITTSDRPDTCLSQAKRG